MRNYHKNLFFNNKYLFVKLLFILIYLIIYLIIFNNNKVFLYFGKLSNFSNNKNININKEYNISNIFNQTNISYRIISVRFSFSFKYNITKFEYNIEFYDFNHTLIIPSDLTLNYNLHVLCQAIELNKNISIISLANIRNNKYFNCIELLNINEKIKFGIRIYNIIKSVTINYFTIFFFDEKIINYNNLLFKNDKEYNPIKLKKKSIRLNSNIYKQINKKHASLGLLKLFYKFPNFSIKSNLAKVNSFWYFKNIYNHFFCFCKFSSNSKCIYKDIELCKYLFYLYIIYNNRLIYKKTDYLLADFDSSSIAPGESFYVFEDMLKKNLSVHYMTKRKGIFKKYRYLNLEKKLLIIYFSYINGSFLEKYLELILKLKSVISGAIIYSISNIFKNIDYITYICIGHGISYLKDFLYKDYYGYNRYNKILLPLSDKIISNAKNYGWSDNNIIKFGLPRWDFFYNIDHNLSKYTNASINSQSIFIMFTWRFCKKYQTLSKFYFKNIMNLINNNELNDLLQLYNITLFFAYHHNLLKYKNLFNFKFNNLIKYIHQNNIINCLKYSSLVITDFSSVIFDFIVRNKPYIIYIPDSEEPFLNQIYKQEYYDVINKFKNGSLQFENVLFSVNETIYKIKYYIINKFEIDQNLIQFYKKFNLQNNGNNIKNFVEYLQNL